MTDIISGEGRKEALLEMTVECPKYKAMCISILVEDCKKCPHYKGIEKLTEIRGVEIFDVVCTFPFRRRITRLVREMKDACTE